MLEIDSYVKQWEKKTEREFFRSGIIASTLANIYREKGSPAFTPLDFVPRKEVPLKPEEARANLDAFFRHVDRLKQRGYLKPVEKKRA